MIRITILFVQKGAYFLIIPFVKEKIAINFLWLQILINKNMKFNICSTIDWETFIQNSNKKGEYKNLNFVQGTF